MPRLAGSRKSELDPVADLRRQVGLLRPARVEPGDFVITHSELDTFRQCPLKHHLAYTLRWDRPSQPGEALTIGALWHQVLQTYYEVLAKVPAGERTQELIQKAQARADFMWLVDEHGQQSDDQALVSWMLDGHRRYWGVERTWEIVAVEQVMRVRLPNPATGRRTPFLLQFKADLLVWDLDLRAPVLIDHKSASNFSRPNEIAISDQFGLYTWGMRELGVPVLQSLRSDARTQRNVGDLRGEKLMPLNTRFQRVPSYRTEVELLSIVQDALSTASVAYADLPVYSSPDPNTCSWKCRFLGAHLLQRKGVPIEKTLRDDPLFHVRERKHDYYPMIEGDERA